jgi:hypothetical protein
MRGSEIPGSFSNVVAVDGTLATYLELLHLRFWGFVCE